MSSQSEVRSTRAQARRLRPRPPREGQAASLPVRHPAYEELSLDDLRALRRGLNDEETRVSYWRRLVQARIDVVRSEGHGEPLSRLTGVLTDVGRSRGRVAALSVYHSDDVPELPALLPLWQRMVAQDDDEGRAALVRDLLAAEAELSHFRADLHRRMDEVTGQLIARLREDPMLALTALPISV